MKKATILILVVLLVIEMLAMAGCSKKPEETLPPAEIRTEELVLKNGEDNIFGMLYLPAEEKNTYPTVILSHGFGVNYRRVEEYARMFAKQGIAAYAFDFRGGGRASKSDGDMTQMSVLTEASDLNAVIDGIKQQSFTDVNNLFLFGESQGGFVSSYVAANRPEEIAGLVLFYPAFVIQDEAHQRYTDPKTMPETEELMGSTVGKIYTIDAVSFDIYEVIGNYKKDVLIVQGDKDALVPLSYSERALEVYDSAVLEVINGGTHGFTLDAKTQASKLALDYVTEHIA